MRIILTNDDAQRLRDTLAANPDDPPGILAKTTVHEGETIYVVAGGVEFPGIARREQDVPGRLRVEDMDGNGIFEAD